ncbi:MAG: hypothetical protein LBR15_02980 [Methanobrevibacter sp.]|jgi:hypothetical protein|nr:hypothetical protein [Candidatus Methanovirga australis]
MFTEYEHVDLYMEYLNGSYKPGSGSHYADAVIFNNNMKLDQFKNAKTVDEKIKLLNHGATIENVLNMVNKTNDPDDITVLPYVMDSSVFTDFSNSIKKYESVGTVLSDGESKVQGTIYKGLNELASKVSSRYMDYHYKVNDSEKLKFSQITSMDNNKKDMKDKLNNTLDDLKLTATVLSMTGTILTSVGAVVIFIGAATSPIGIPVIIAGCVLLAIGIVLLSIMGVLSNIQSTVEDIINRIDELVI